MTRKGYNSYSFILFLLIVLPTFFSCTGKSGYSRLIGKVVDLPCNLPDTVNCCYVYIVRDHDCTRCSVGTLYQWNETISMVGREDISFLFIVEARPEDTDEIIEEALSRRPFHQPIFIDYSHLLLKENPWINRNKEIDGFLIDKSLKVVSVGNPLIDSRYLKKLKSVSL